MSCAEAMADDLGQFGDPDELADAEDLVMLKLERPLPAGRTVPKQFTLSGDRSTLTMDYLGFVGNRSFLVKQCYPRALFAGCPGLKSAKGFLTTAQDVLCKTHTLVIVHNRDAVVDLTAWFPDVLALILFHNLNCQRIEKAHVQGNRPISRLQRLCGTTPGIGADELYLGPFTLTNLFACCPEVAAVKPDVISRISNFPLLTRLCLMCYDDTQELCRFDRLTKVLEELSLTHLKLVCFTDVSLRTISETCKHLQSLSLSGSEVCNEDVPCDAFPKLRSLALADGIAEKPFFSLLRAARGLTDLRLENYWTVMMFVGGPMSSPRPRHELLRRLTLGTDFPVTKLQVSIADLRDVMQSAPSLAALCTDSYDIRMFVGSYHPRVRLTWTTCTACTAEFPKMDSQQEDMWRNVFMGGLL
ncbi:uncharacterized protein LOC119464167 isoform X2 [Dermacentor silvarum]|uniref:uncharacterized protein LOC119464167 isoform X2 n=1 Tax=Dermacentor silvarum TaxID=543639 RepID=UPI00189C1DF4|nr:uncharacterized protein LOC119464167 isoform X2 [Dermacentor silvarum]